MKTAPSDPLADLAADVKRIWGGLAAATAAIVAIVGVFLLPPPFYGVDAWVNYSKFLIATLVALGLTAMLKWRDRKTLRWWIIVTISSFALASLLFLVYQWLLLSRTCSYATHLVVIGNVLTPDGQNTLNERIQHGLSANCEDLIPYYGGQLSSIWVRDGIHENRLFLSVVYVIDVGLFSAIVLCVVQVLSILGLAGLIKEDENK